MPSSELLPLCCHAGRLLRGIAGALVADFGEEEWLAGLRRLGTSYFSTM
jgi:hypothetical protein